MYLQSQTNSLLKKQFMRKKGSPHRLGNVHARRKTGETNNLWLDKYAVKTTFGNRQPSINSTVMKNNDL